MDDDLYDPAGDELRAPYMPTPAQIRQATAEIRADWTERKHRTRSGTGQRSVFWARFFSARRSGECSFGRLDD